MVISKEMVNKALRNPEKGAFAKGALRKLVANCAPNLRKIAGTLIFFSLPFWKNKEKPTKTARILCRGRTPKILGKETKNVQKSKDFLEKKKARKSKTARKRRSGYFASYIRGRVRKIVANLSRI